MPKLLAPKAKKKVLQISNRPAHQDDSDGSMPGLQSVSNSSDDDDDSDEDSDSDDDLDFDDDDDDEESDESEYDEEQEDELRDMLREAMDAAHEADWFHNTEVPVEIDPLEDVRKGNPFLKLLGSLRGMHYHVADWSALLTLFCFS